MNSYSKYTPVESCLDIYDSNRLWYYIPGFNGYEVSNDGYVRSMKHYHKYPYGILIVPKKNKKGEIKCPQDVIFEISDNNNERQLIHLSQLIYLAKTNPYGVAGYPRCTIITDTSSRNDRKFIKSKNKMKIPPIDKDWHYAKFTIIEDGKSTLNMTKKDYNEIICPLVAIKGDQYYGREDCRIRQSGDVSN